MMRNTSEIIVLLAHYNDNERLKTTIDSIREPFPIDVLILDDGSSIRPNEDELKVIYGNRGNLAVEYSVENQGVSRVRNWGLELILKSDYQYIGIMDSDDTNNPERFSKQLTYLKKNQHIYLLGTWGEYYSRKGEYLFTLKHPTSYREIKKKMYLNSTFLHSSILFKKEIIESVGGYSEKYKKGGEDYDFLFKIIKKYQVENYPESLVNITVTENGLSSKQRFWQVYNRIRIIKDNFYFGFHPVFGIIRNSILLVVPRNIGIKFRKWFKIEKMSI